MQTKFFFDYIFYRVSKAYLKWEGKAGILTGSLAVTMIQSFSIATISAIFIKLFYTRDETSSYAKSASWIAIVIVLLISFWNQFVYSKERYEKLLTHWQDEPETQKVQKGILVVIAMAIPAVALALIGIYW